MPMRWSGVLLASLLLLVAAACGSPGADGGNGGNGGDGGAPAGDGNGDGGGNGGQAGDVGALEDALEPPNSTEMSRTSTADGTFVVYHSDDSVDSLADFYEDALADAGMEVLSTTSTEGGHSWAFAQDQESEFGGQVTVFPSSSGGGSDVTVTLVGD